MATVREEKRHFDRIPTTLKCCFEENGTRHEGFIVNVSSHGVGTTSEVPLEIGTKKELMFMPTNMTVPALVCWCQEEGTLFTIGWLFQEAAPEIISIARQLELFWKDLK